MKGYLIQKDINYWSFHRYTEKLDWIPWNNYDILRTYKHNYRFTKVNVYEFSVTSQKLI